MTFLGGLDYPIWVEEPGGHFLGGHPALEKT